jgi:hypothetical protein
LQPAGRLLGLLEILLARAPEDHAAGYAPDRDGDVELTGDAQEIVFHALRPDLRAQMDADRLARERLNLLAQRVVEHRLHARSSAHAAGFIQGHVFKLNTGGLVGHRIARFLGGGLREG